MRGLAGTGVAGKMRSNLNSKSRFTMQWMQFSHQGQVGFGLLDGGMVQVCTGSMFSGAQPTSTHLPVADVQWLPPCQPGQMIGLWNNFRAAAEKNGWATPDEPLYFIKSTSSLTAHGQAIPVPPAYAGRVFYEGELAVVIGRTARAVSAASRSATPTVTWAAPCVWERRAATSAPARWRTKSTARW